MRLRERGRSRIADEAVREWPGRAVEARREWPGRAG